MLSGRLGGAEMSRCEHQHQGRLPLQDLSAEISYGFTEAKTPHGHIGVKCWIFIGKYGPKSARAGIGMRRPVEKPRGEAES
jgi:small subunit ribosomal protein S3